MPDVVDAQDHHEQEQPVKPKEHDDVDNLENDDWFIARLQVSEQITTIVACIQEVADAHLTLLDGHNSWRIGEERGDDADDHARDEATLDGPPD